MIEKMKRLDAVMLMEERNSFLAALQALGVVHLESKAKLRDEGFLVERIARFRRTQLWLDEIAARFDARIPAAPYRGDLDELCERSETARRRVQELDQSIREAREKASRLAQWGRFDPEVVRHLERNGLLMAFGSCALPQFRPEGGENVVVESLNEEGGAVHFCVFYHKQDKLGEIDKRILSYREEVPIEDLHEIERQLEAMNRERDEVLRAVIDDTRYRVALSYSIEQISDMLMREDAEAGLEAAADGTVCFVHGYFPVRLENSVREFLEARELVFFLEDPGHHDEVPVKLRQNPFTRLFAPILGIFSLPNYHELDTTPFFAPFYTLFFGLCVADVGYGLVMLAILFVAFLRIKDKALMPTLALGFVLSASVVFGGVILDDYFGMRMNEDTFRPAGETFLAHLGLFREQRDAMLLPILLGVIQVFFGYVLRMVNHIRRFGWQGAMLPLGVLCVIGGGALGALSSLGPAFKIGPLPVGLLGVGVRPDVWMIIVFFGLACILLFNGLAQGRKWYLRPLAGLWNLYELATGLPGDILSYLRLFALGLAGGLLAEAVNHIASTLVEGGGNPFTYLAMAAVLFIGHGLNFGIGLLSAFVHSLRLTFVEFYKAIEFEGGGKPFTAFATRAGKEPDYSILSTRAAQ